MIGRHGCLARLVLLLALQVPAIGSLAAAESAPAEATDEAGSDDGKTRWGKLLPLPIFVTEPAIGEGLGATLIYFHHQDEKEIPRVSTAREIGKTGERSKPPPTATGIFGFYTNQDSFAAGIGHSNTFDDDNYRLQVAAAETRINSNLYIGDLPTAFRLEGSLLFSRAKRRLGRAGTFVGLSLMYLDAETRFGSSLPGLEGSELLKSGFTDAGLALSLTFDTRDNTMLPSSGVLAEAASWYHHENIGSDFDYRKHRLRTLYFTPFAARYVLGLRLDVSSASGEVPFYMAPFVNLKGIPAWRYQGRTAGAVEIEVRRLLGDLWSVSAFTGSGFVDTGFDFGETENDIATFGIGLRYLVLPKQDAWVGLDIARGPEDTAWYVQIGSSW